MYQKFNLTNIDSICKIWPSPTTTLWTQKRAGYYVRTDYFQACTYNLLQNIHRLCRSFCLKHSWVIVRQSQWRIRSFYTKIVGAERELFVYLIIVIYHYATGQDNVEKIRWITLRPPKSQFYFLYFYIQGRLGFTDLSIIELE